MLDVPITYKGEMIGVICIENLKQRNWKEDEINFAQMLSALYSFAHSVKENDIVTKNIKNIELINSKPFLPVGVFILIK